MKRLWLADVHANLPAFQAVLRDAGNYDEAVFLGDIVGYGPHPAECVSLLMEINPKAVIGNHDRAVLSRKDRQASSLEPSKSWDDQAYLQLDEHHISYLSKLPENLRLNSPEASAKAFHGLPGLPYLHPNMPDYVMAEFIRDMPSGLIFTGHSHYALDRVIGEIRLVCVPSAGQPRNSSPEAGYAIEENGLIAFRTVPYDVEKTARDVSSLGLPEPFASRWLNFLKTGYDAGWSREWILNENND